MLGYCGGIDVDIVDGIMWVFGGEVLGVFINYNFVKVINLSFGGLFNYCLIMY